MPPPFNLSHRSVGWPLSAIIRRLQTLICIKFQIERGGTLTSLVAGECKYDCKIGDITWSLAVGHWHDTGRAPCVRLRNLGADGPPRELVSDRRLGLDRALTKGEQHDMLAQRDCSRYDFGIRGDRAHQHRDSRRAGRLRRPDRVRTIGGLRGPRGGVGSRHAGRYSRSFNEANATGGVNGRRLELVSYDDGYEPEKAIANTKRLIDENGVFALVGEVGTPTSNAAQPIATEAGVPFIGPFTGAAFLRNPSLGNVINIRGSYDQETEAWIEHLTTDLGVSRIAILYQDDTFGRAGLSGVSKAMEKRGMKLVAEGTYERNTTAVKTALLAIRKADPEAVVMVGAYKPCAEFIKLAHRLKLNAVFVNISFVGANALAKELGEDGKEWW